MFRPIMNAWQTLSVVLMTSSEWPASVKFIQKYVLQTVNFDVISLSSPACVGAKMNFYHRFVATIIGCSILVSFPWLLSLNTFLKRKRTTETGEKWEKARALRLHDSGLLMLLIYMLVTVQVLNFFQCASVVSTANTTATTTATTTTKKTHFLISDYSLSRVLRPGMVGHVPTRPHRVMRVFAGRASGNRARDAAPKGPARRHAREGDVGHALQTCKNVMTKLKMMYVRSVWCTCSAVVGERNGACSISSYSSIICIFSE